MQLVLSRAETDPAWDQFVAASPYGHLLQSSAWGAFKSAHGWRALRVGLRDGEQIVAGAQVLFRHLPVGTVAYIPRGPVLAPDDPACWAALFDEVQRAARAAGAIFLKVEPPWEDDPGLETRLAALGFRVGRTVQPRSTICLDLTPTLDDILAQMKPKWRYNIRLAARKGVQVRPATEAELPAFYALMQATSQRDGFAIHDARYYADAWRRFVPTGQGELFLATFEDDLLGAIMVFALGRTAIYMYGASSDRERNRMPNHLLQWTAIQWAKAHGCTVYDLWGIPDQVQGTQVHRYTGTQVQDTEEGDHQADSPGTSNHESEGGLWGVWRFKQGFGGRVVRFIGAFEVVYRPVLYWLGMRLLPRLRGRT